MSLNLLDSLFLIQILIYFFSPSNGLKVRKLTKIIFHIIFFLCALMWNRIRINSLIFDNYAFQILKSSKYRKESFNWYSIIFRQAARLTTACSMIQSIGHEVRIRPFVYQSTPGEDLDTILLYTSSLEMYARLFRVPITGRYLCLFLTIGSILILTLGQCQFF